VCMRAGAQAVSRVVVRASRMGNATAKRKMATIGTHDGSFHCDEALGCFMLQQLPEFKGSAIVRTRDPEKLKGCDVVIDVGGVYDLDACRFDHHQRGFDGVFGHGFSTKLSSAGLVYKHYGRSLVAQTLGLDESSAEANTVWLKVYASFVEAVDGIDNGVSQYDSDKPARYANHTGLSSRVGSLNPRWNEPDPPERYDEQFAKAMALAGGEFLAAVRYAGEAWLPARRHVKEALDKRHEVDASGEILRLDTFCPWKEHLFELEKEGSVDPLPKYVLYQDQKGAWRIQAVPVTPDSFDQRRGLPKAWRGVRDAELSELAGVPGCIFVHAGGFIGGNATLEGAMEMARKALTLEC